jgi:hypothetical protein
LSSHLTRAMIGAAIAVAMLPFPATAAAGAEPFQCTGEASATTIAASVVVPAGAACALSDVAVLGNVAVYGSLSMAGGSVGGTVSSSGGQVHLVGVDVAGHVSVSRPGESWQAFAGPSFAVCISSVAGNVTVDQGTAGHSSSVSPSACGSSAQLVNTIGGSLAFLNQQAGHSAFVQSTNVHGNLICSGAGSFLAIQTNVSGGTFNTCPAP